jgi:predicted Zn-dependent protease with MMP-like domain
MTIEDYQGLINKIVDDLPVGFKEKLSNVEIVAEIWPTKVDLESINAEHGTILYGLYRGVPQTKRGSYTGAIPDKIAIFLGPIISVYKTEDRVVEQIRSTVLHEIGHHFGMTEQQIRAAERERKLKNNRT